MQEQKHNERHVKWDEQKLKQTQKYRGTFEKIDEPKTPYHKNSDSDQEMQVQQKSEEQLKLDESLYKAKMNCNTNTHKKINIAELNAKLKEELQKYHTGEEMIDQQEQQRQRKKKEFNKKRAQHYNQYKLIQQMKQQRWEDEDD